LEFSIIIENYKKKGVSVLRRWDLLIIQIQSPYYFFEEKDSLILHSNCKSKTIKPFI